MAIFSVTDRGTFRRCRRMWDYSSNARQNLTRIGAGSEPLELGGLIHRALAEWVVHPKEKLQTLFYQETNKRLDEIRQSYLESVGASISEEELAPIYEVVTLGAAMMQNYQEHWGSPIPDNMQFASAEQSVEVPVPGTEHPCPDCFGTGLVKKLNNNPENHSLLVNKCFKCDGLGVSFHYLSATLDGMLQDKRGRLYVLEHKTYGNRPKMIDLTMMDQFTGYAWILCKLNIGPVAGVAYDGMWKREVPPRPVRKGLPLATLSDLFIRVVLPKNEETILEWGEQLTKEINEMANDPEIYPNVPWMGCGDCSFRDVCNMQLRGEDPSHLIKTSFIQRQVIRGGGIRNEEN